MTEELKQNPKILGVVEYEKVDLKVYEGVKTTIASVEYAQHPKNGTYVKLKTVKLNTDNDKFDIQASKILGVIDVKDDDGNKLGIGWGEDSKTALFFKKHGVKDFESLIGKEVIIVREVKKDGKEYLTF